MFIYRHDGRIIVLLLYVDDIVLIGNDTSYLDSFVATLSSQFAMKDLGALHYFLGIEVTTTPSGLFLSQSKYALDILQRAHMVDIKPISTPMALRSSVEGDSCPFIDVTLYRSIVGGLQYLTMTRPDLSYAVNSVCQHMHSPTVAHFGMVKHILRYVKGTLDHGLWIVRASSLTLYGFSDSDWAGCPLTRRSTTGFCTFLGANCISWSAKKQSTVSRSSTEAEYRAMASTIAELTWLTFLLWDLGIPQYSPITLFCDNISALHMMVNPVFHARSKHIELDYHFVREKVALGHLVTWFVPSRLQVADLFTKPLARWEFHALCLKLGLSSRLSLREGINHLSTSSHPRGQDIT
ncbi:uncharacterized mitochondrial protein AtMg00810-like [Telopea speciosissima]|uniref:uncharacterized mitochondrial protein AtMg00810-like n=1 Tax=Telopea speciosissima TaxID=54955 RepID=UPI001CC7CD0B|nr:uncharacterized mitochondrial protein AtMg00810-like [Telopea speciosissima]